MANSLGIMVVAGTPRRIDAACPVCGWADLWEFTAHSLTPSGVGVLGVIRQCARCTKERRRALE